MFLFARIFKLVVLGIKEIDRICVFVLCIREENLFTSDVLVIPKKIVESERRAMLPRSQPFPLQGWGQPEGTRTPSPPTILKYQTQGSGVHR